MTRDAESILRVVRFRPYRRGMGPQFRLTLWDTYQTRFGKSMLGYRLSMGAGGENAAGNPAAWKVVFEGTDFGASPAHAVDSDETVKGVMAFLTLRPGDTDSDYFAAYTPAQLAYCEEHAEALSVRVMDRFGE